jgi:hypothetical protein
MTRLDRVLKLLKDYDNLVLAMYLDEVPVELVPPHLDELRKEKAQLTQELIEHGCRRKN